MPMAYQSIYPKTYLLKTVVIKRCLMDYAKLEGRVSSLTESEFVLPILYPTFPQQPYLSSINSGFIKYSSDRKLRDGI
jgi:hypothetical protein